MNTIGKYALEVHTRRSFEEAAERVVELLAEQGFGVLTEIDVRATLKKKLGIESKPYKIFGACNPQFAHRTLEIEPHIGVLLPCNVVVWDEGRHRVVAALEPLVMADVVGGEELQEVAREVSNRIHKVLEQIS